MACNKFEYLSPKTPPNQYKKMYNCNGDRPKNSHSQSTKTSSFSLKQVPVIRCPCGNGACSIFTSHSENNPNRMYYTCYQKGSLNKCGFFRWVDEVVKFEVPQCTCGAGASSLNIDEEGRWFFACRIKKGHGACRFFQWADVRTNGRMNMHFHDKISCSCPQYWKPSPQDVTTSRFEDDEAAFWANVVQELESSNHKGLNNCSSMEVEINNVDSYSIVHATKSSNHQFFGTLPSEEAQVPNRKSETKPENSQLVVKPPPTPTKNAQVSGGVSGYHPSYPNRNKRQNDSTASSFFEYIGQGLLKTLKDKNLVNREDISKISESVFKAFCHLSISHSSFCKHVMKYIECKSRVGAEEGSMREGLSYHELEGIFKCAEAECVGAESHLQWLNGESSCGKKRKLFRNLDQELEQSETKTLEWKTSLFKINPE